MKINPTTKFQSFSALLFLIVMFISPASGQHGIVINEMVSSNSSGMADEDEEYNDWIELYNYTDTIIDMTGWGLSDNYIEPFKWIFPQINLHPKEHIMVWASGKDRTSAPSAHQVFIPQKSQWKYLDNGSNQGTAWRNAGYDDSSWSSGAAMLGYDTNNNTLFGTQISYGGNTSMKYITSYFRKEFTVIDKSRFQDIILTLMIDDGAVVYLNGQEVTRVNMPTGAIDYMTLSSGVVTSLDVSYHMVPSELLLNGENIIAVEVHQTNSYSSDLRFDLELVSKGRNLHTNFSISSEGEAILLTHPTLGQSDSLPPQVLPANVSIGRWPDGVGEYAYYTQPTPGESNPELRYTEILPPPVFSHEAGFYGDAFQLTLSASDPEVKIIYTIDGSEPDPGNLGGTSFEYRNSFPGTSLYSSFTSSEYTSPLLIEDRTPQPEYISTFTSDYFGFRYTSSIRRLFKGTVVRAIAIKEGAVPSSEVTRTYFIHPELNNRYSLPVYSLTLPVTSLFDYSTGIYTPGITWDQMAGGTRDGGAPANYNRREPTWERKANLEIFDGSPTVPVINQLIGIRTHGGWSRAYPMKSLRLYPRKSYGEDSFNHKLFPDLPYTSFETVILRNSGNDFGSSYFRDAAAQAVVSGLRIDTQAYQPVILFINGEYWGIHNLRDRYDKDYLERKYGINPDNIDFLEINGGGAVEGDRVHYNTMVSYLERNNLALKPHYDYIRTMMDVENFIDYQISHIYIANTDWPGNNNDFWRLRVPYTPHAPYGHDGRWRWLVFDTDFGFGLFNNAYNNTVIQATSPVTTWQNPPYSTVILRRLLLNESFKNDFINRFNDLLNTHLGTMRATGIINTMRNRLRPEIQEHIWRWSKPGNVSSWENEVNKMTSFVLLRPSQVRQHLRQYFQIPGDVKLTLNVSNPQHGYIRVNTIEITPSTPGVSQNPYPWSGLYFQGIPVELEAISKPGYTFLRWEGLPNAALPKATGTFNTSSVSVKAIFTESSLIHNWHFNYLIEGILDTIPANISLTSPTGELYYAGTGAGFLDRVANGTDLNIIDGAAAGYGLRVRNPSTMRELILNIPTTGYQNITLSYATMRTGSGAEIQEVHYRTSPTSSWVLLRDMIRVEEQWAVQRFNFPSATADNNPYLAVRITFKGENTIGETGNNRFDNIRVEGMDMKLVAVEQPSEGLPDFSEKLNVWHHGETLFLENPFHGEARLHVYTTAGVPAGDFGISGRGQHSLNFYPAGGIYIVKLISPEGVASGKIFCQ